GRAPHRLMRVRDEIDNDLVELMGGGPEDGKLLRQVEDDLDVVGPQLVGEQLDRLSNHLIEGHLMTLRRLLAGQGEEVADDARAALGCRADLLGSPSERSVPDDFSHEMRLPHEDGQGVVELMRDTGEQGSHRGELLAPQKLLRSLLDRLLERSVVAL